MSDEGGRIERKRATRENNILAVLEGLFVWESMKGLVAIDDDMATGKCAEMLEVGGEAKEEGALIADSPVLIDGDNEVH